MLLSQAPLKTFTPQPKPAPTKTTIKVKNFLNEGRIKQPSP
jgi:hypothetical protein